MAQNSDFESFSPIRNCNGVRITLRGSANSTDGDLNQGGGDENLKPLPLKIDIQQGMVRSA